MLRVIVDSGSSIKQDEKEMLNVDIIPLKVLIDEKEYQDGVDLDYDFYYDTLINRKIFPKTSLPCLTDLEDMVKKYTDAGDDVIIVTISSKISGSFNAIKLLFEDNDKVNVIDSLTAVGGVRFIVDCINMNRDLPVPQIIKNVNNLIPRIKVRAIPETLEYLHRGGRLSKMEMILGSILSIKPIIGFIDGKVRVITKKHGVNNSMKFLASDVLESGVDPQYGIIASYTYNKENLEKLIKYTDQSLVDLIKVYDDLTPSIASHWGPNAFGYIYVEKAE